MSGQSFGISYGKVGRLKLSRPRQQTRKCLLVCSIGRKKKGFSNQAEGKKAALGILNSVKSSLVHQKVEEKRKALYSNFYDENQTYLLFYEDGQKVFFLHGTSELFTLKWYYEELGKDHNTRLQPYGHEWWWPWGWRYVWFTLMLQAWDCPSLYYSWTVCKTMSSTK